MVKSWGYIPTLRLMPGIQRWPPTEDLRVGAMDIPFLGPFFPPLFFITWRSFEDNLLFNSLALEKLARRQCKIQIANFKMTGAWPSNLHFAIFTFQFLYPPVI